MKAFLEQYQILIYILESLYFIGIVLLSVKIIIDTKTTSKTLAYLLLIIFLPIVGILIYFFFGVNYRKNKFYHFKIKRNEKVYNEIQHFVARAHDKVLESHQKELQKYFSTFSFLFHGTQSPLTESNKVELLINGEEKFPKVFEVLKSARHHIHLEYYIFEDDYIGRELSNILIEKAKNNVVVRMLYDDLGSGKLSKSLKEELKSAGVEIYPVNKITFRLFANRVNYRDHRKIIIVDGREVFSGGINVSQKYVNDKPDKLFWRDTHLYIKGNGAFYYQFLFLSNWIFSTQKLPKIDASYFNYSDFDGEQIVQVAASGPDTKPAIMMSTVSAIYSATKRIYITTPYFIPVEAVLQAIKQMAQSGIDVRLLVPAKGDSKLVNAAAYSYYEELLESGVKIYFYEKGFVHAKTIVIDDDLSIIGTANMDIRSQELNFEVNTMVYDKLITEKLTASYYDDLTHSKEIFLKDWKLRPKLKTFFEHLARLFSPLL
ncbi:cardiolipin synthase [Soonwooa sp.]|uniref:cardiolipin synthase n=1 Tax=Soonwooa sp. TaxID=1938592 RepID=UPI00262D0CB9|nr:cardiolipin synthase [Soonwooa sp.]